ncbi:MAG: sterile alpha motif-like domain-containing protein [Ruminococcus sp.]|nr:sterile alpha motif-like domain-containing protein [Ruminococcus sp.]
MIRNNRPYTDENGRVDDKLITSRTDAEIHAVAVWIQKNIRHEKKVLDGRTSYGMKHILQHDTGIYLTNNEFKDAMLLAGFQPVNPNELNWRYKISLVRYINENHSPFFQWAVRTHDGDNSPLGDFVSDMKHSLDFPTLSEKTIIEWYLYRKDACDEAFKAFADLWEEFENA